MIAQSSYERILKVIVEGEEENQNLLNYIKTILPEKANDEEYIERITYNVYEIYDEIELDIDIHSIADNYINILREVKTF
ncbi:hypothetical protein [Romboutsia sp.]|uniref:hypothetical protein n=1 Tax=Romboutsia sp. TaxID=1965302 RepID=UPI003F32771B